MKTLSSTALKTMALVLTLSLSANATDDGPSNPGSKPSSNFYDTATAMVQFVKENDLSPESFDSLEQLIEKKGSYDFVDGSGAGRAEVDFYEVGRVDEDGYYLVEIGGFSTMGGRATGSSFYNVSEDRLATPDIYTLESEVPQTSVRVIYTKDLKRYYVEGYHHVDKSFSIKQSTGDQESNQTTIDVTVTKKERVKLTMEEIMAIISYAQKSSDILSDEDRDFINKALGAGVSDYSLYWEEITKKND